MRYDCRPLGGRNEPCTSLQKRCDDYIDGRQVSLEHHDHVHCIDTWNTSFDERRCPFMNSYDNIDENFCKHVKFQQRLIICIYSG